MSDGAYVFLDESGDSGFKLDKGSTPVFCMAAIIVPSPTEIQAIELAIAELRTQLHLPRNYEFHFFSESARVREAFCRQVVACPFTVRAIVVDKTRITSPRLRQRADLFYNFITRMLLQHNFATISMANVRIDGHTNRPLKTYLRQQLNKGTVVVASIKFSDSKNDSLIQLADMVAGSIARSYLTEKKDHGTYRGLLRRRISDVWEFGKDETGLLTPSGA